MEQQKRWQFVVIGCVLVLTLYNIIPSILYYGQNLQEPVGPDQAKQIAKTVVDRLDSLDLEGKEWLESFQKTLGVSGVVSMDPHTSGLYRVQFPNREMAQTFRRFLPQAGALIPSVPSQLSLSSRISEDPQEVFVQRNGMFPHLTDLDASLWHFSWKESSDGTPAPEYRSWVYERVAPVASALTYDGSMERLGVYLQAAQGVEQTQEALLSVAKTVDETVQEFGKDHEMVRFMVASLSRSWPDAVTDLPHKVQLVLENLQGEQDAVKRQMLEQLATLVKSNPTPSSVGISSSTFLHTLSQLRESSEVETVSLEGHNPWIQSLLLDWKRARVEFVLTPSIAKRVESVPENEEMAIDKDRVLRALYRQFQALEQKFGEKVTMSEGRPHFPMLSTWGVESFLSLRLDVYAKALLGQLQHWIQESWNPKSRDFSPTHFPIQVVTHFDEIPQNASNFGLYLYAPVADSSASRPEQMQNHSIYLIARGVKTLLHQVQGLPQHALDKMYQDLEGLKNLVEGQGFLGYDAAMLGVPQKMEQDFVFQWPHFSRLALAASREPFVSYGAASVALLPFSTRQERILVENRIGDEKQAELLKWREEYQKAQSEMNFSKKVLVPPPTKSPLVENIKLSVEKVWRGDPERVLQWGLDLSGGKAVRIGLLDPQGAPVTAKEDLEQAVEELYQRVNKLGVSERTLRIENDSILMEFPGSQGLSAQELVKASSMTFHLVNEKFGVQNPALQESVQLFLQDIWNEAVVTGKMSLEQMQTMAYEKLGRNMDEPVEPRSAHAERLFQAGLRFADPKNTERKSSFDDTISTLGRFRGDEYSEWMGQSHPLVILFAHYALEGVNLDDIRVGYDPSDGNSLSFEIKSVGDKKSSGGNPQDILHSWTSKFSQEAIVGTPLEKYTGGRGYRMAAVLNEQIISAPHLKGSLRNRASISGRFTQKEVTDLAADLKAGSLSFTPKIISENNISPDLGRQDRQQGIIASVVALVAVVLIMCGYYRFFGLIASMAVLINLVIIWGVLQTIGAALTLPGIAGIVLTIGMAVDANVLVFERMREEFAQSKRLAGAIHAGYKKAFSAILDSNITTILAALILIQFDSGPIKGFAVTLIIGVISSMFTSLFMTRYYFAGWIQRNGNASLNFFQGFDWNTIPFMSQSKWVAAVSALCIAVGSFVVIQERATILGMDFTGGYAVTLDVSIPPEANETPRVFVQHVLDKAGLSSLDYSVKQLSRPTQLRIELAAGMEQEGNPFYQMPLERIVQEPQYTFQTNPRLSYLMDTLENGGVLFAPHTLEGVHMQWSLMSGSFSETMKTHAILALSMALLAILFYITLRFEWIYAVSAVIGLVHDLFITMGCIGVFHSLGFPVQIDLVVVGALMTLIGYSLNDTIIVFDRIREDVRLMRKSSLSQIIDHALNTTLSRTLMTSGTTLVVLLSLLLLGGPSLFAFGLVMTLGVVFGTISSIYIAPLCLKLLRERERRAHLLAKS